MPSSKRCWWIIAALLLSLELSPFSQAQEETLAIFRFRPTNFEAMGDSSELLLAIMSAIEEDRSINLMPRREMEEILTQKAIPQTDNTAMVQKAGRELAVDCILYGQVTRDTRGMTYAGYLMDIRSGQVIRSWAENFGSPNDVISRMPSFISELADAMSRPAAAPPPVVKKAPEPVMEIRNLKARVANGTPILTWRYDPTLPIEVFSVYRSRNRDGPYEQIGRTRIGSYRDKALGKGQACYYRLGIVATSGKETRSNTIVSVKESVTLRPHPPVIRKGTARVRRIQLEFIPSLQNRQDNFKIVSYSVYRKIGEGDEWRKAVTVPAQREALAGLTFEAIDREGLEDGKAYSYAVSATAKDGQESRLSDPIQLTTTQIPVLRSEERKESRKIRLSWNIVEHAGGYNVYRSTDRMSWKRIGQVLGTAQSEYVDTDGLTDGQQYRYYVSAYDQYGETGPSNKLDVRTKDAPTYPENILVRSGGFRAVKIGWDPANDIDAKGYRVYRGSDRNSLDPISTIEGRGTGTHMDKGTSREPLRDGEDYYYAISSLNSFGAEGTRSPAVPARTKPRPGNAKGISAAFKDGGIDLTWEKNPEGDIQRYVLYRSRNGRQWSHLTDLGADRSSYRDEDIRPEDAYGYRIVAEDGDGLKSDPAESRPVTSEIETLLIVEKDNLLRQIELTWKPLKNVNGYNIYRKSGERDWHQIAGIKNAAAQRHTDRDDLMDGKHYQYYLASFDSEGETGPSNEVSAKTKDLPPFPENVNAKSSLVKTVEISWDPINDADIGGYKIYRGTAKDKLVLVATVKDYRSGSYEDKGTGRKLLRDGSDYHYSVAGFNTFNAGGESSPPVMARTKPRPGPVKRVSAAFEKDGINVAWEKNVEPDIRHYTIYRSRNAREWSRLRELSADQSTYRDEDLRPEDAYGYRIIAEDGDGLKSDPAESPPVVSKIETLLVVEKDNLLRQIDLSWKPLENVSGYNIYRRSEDRDWQRVARIRSAATGRHTDKKELLDGRAYQYYLTSFDGEGETTPSNEVGAKTKDLPSFPANIAAKSGLLKSVEISWDAGSDADIGGYNVYRGTTRDALKAVAKVRGHKSASYLDKGAIFQSLKHGTVYYYAVAGFNRFGAEGERCPVLEARTKPRPMAVKGLSVSIGEDEIGIKWDVNPEPDIKQYTVFRRQGNGSWSKIATRAKSQQTSYTDSNLRPKSTYSYRVVAEDATALKSDPTDSDPVESPLAVEEE